MRSIRWSPASPSRPSPPAASEPGVLPSVAGPRAVSDLERDRLASMRLPAPAAVLGRAGWAAAGTGSGSWMISTSTGSEAGGRDEAERSSTEGDGESELTEDEVRE
jgi:hypothetical protein